MKNQQIFKERRERFLVELGETAAIIPAANMVSHHADCEYPFRQNSDFWYLTGFDEPEAVALFLPHRPKGEQYVLFVLPKEPSAEIWNGFRWGTEGVLKHFNADLAFPLDELSKRLVDYLYGAEDIAFRIGKHSKIEPLVLKAWSDLLERSPRDGFSPQRLTPPCPLLHQLRLKKEPWEIQRMKEAARISSNAHELARQITRPGISEREVQAVIEQSFLEQGARGPAYGSIVAGGENACILHYTANNAFLKDRELLLIDAGCSLDDYYNADITRTFPINGRFNHEQKALYEIVLAAQTAAIQLALPGRNTEEVHLKAVSVLVEGLIDLGLLKGSIDSLIERGLYRHFYMHRTGHWLGLDVHDVGAYRLGEYPVPLEPGMVLTVEPGLYISDLLSVPEGQPSIEEHWKNIGIRIEDDVLVTKDEPEVITLNALKSVNEMER
ncbi:MULTISPECIES: aminopeptidase P N-terminal domain-containing protein [Prochlorococcus]|uniref:Xaa-Pro aminopeptidase n=1 Tax=Prochlorococcus marinus (strain SARG / CCMP1375 / SS120) TaxID=167539 RepID=Q7VA72_PROMA|nr:MULTISPECIES: aminopeptidase P N-terminal domain-containing protein [Prochlorococcus]AAQ00639.1 Xaa-Pro aminopeptidase [Prochlorococcus marinus subsp. marinus str. CCMP1375]KGG10866.1 Xaa-Pro aminopeptidase [Prochlorococcus marinus str. LG]KGG20446.1 Xaa-Pro aminopeptidase [Prochlorococcus marinus str. SS2]KGG24115.1 Xaa-Pro aminopeptidase [Prochlorococcus marinus str. SS35]KGG31628.1 Xaa-Pro aminopeptidase [Prochlorococcus marinus str. SS51]